MKVSNWISTIALIVLLAGILPLSSSQSSSAGLQRNNGSTKTLALTLVYATKDVINGIETITVKEVLGGMINGSKEPPKVEGFYRTPKDKPRGKPQQTVRPPFDKLLENKGIIINKVSAAIIPDNGVLTIVEKEKLPLTAVNFTVSDIGTMVSLGKTIPVVIIDSDATVSENGVDTVIRPVVTAVAAVAFPANDVMNIIVKGSISPSNGTSDVSGILGFIQEEQNEPQPNSYLDSGAVTTGKEFKVFHCATGETFKPTCPGLRTNSTSGKPVITIVQSKVVPNVTMPVIILKGKFSPAPETSYMTGIAGLTASLRNS